MRRNEKIINGKYIIGNLIGEGSYGEIYAGVDIERKQEIAIKIETRDKKFDFLKYEVAIYKQLQGCPGIPRLFWAGCEGNYYIMILELLGKSLDSLRSQCLGQLSEGTVLKLGVQMLQRIETFHENELLHRDVKPSNFIMGKGATERTVYIIDYGLAKRYIVKKTGIHIPYAENKSLIGTARYVSINSHMGIEPTRRDDLEGLAYSLIFLFVGHLPWQGLHSASKQRKYQKIMECKTEIKPEVFWKGISPPLLRLLLYSRSLNFDQRPNYEKLKDIFENYFQDQQLFKGFDFDWNLLKIPIPSRSSHDRASHRRMSTKEAQSRAIAIRKLISSLPPMKNTLKRHSMFYPKVELLNSETPLEESKEQPTVKSPVKINGSLPTQEITNSCNFMDIDIKEHPCIGEDAIPAELPLHSSISIPIANFIQNERFYSTHKEPRKSRLNRRSQTDKRLNHLLLDIQKNNRRSPFSQRLDKKSQ